MKTDLRIWSYLAQFFLEWDIFRTKVVEQIITNTLCSVTFFFNRTAYELTGKNFERRKVSILHHGIARPQVTDRGVASNLEGSSEND
jgi:hypothetical protein